MDSQDLHIFEEWFDVLAVTHRLQARDEQRERMQAEYFDVLRFYPLVAVRSAYESLRRKMKKWPVPADWLEALPPWGSRARLPMLTPEELQLNDEAERLGYEREDFCHCVVCERDTTTHLLSRYVPIVIGLEEQVIERQHPTRQGRPVLLGRWIHGNELRRWYAARAMFYEKFAEIKSIDEAERRRRRGPDERIQRLDTLAASAVAQAKA